MAESLHIDVKQDDNGSEKADRFDQKVSSLERIFLIANFILELPSAAFDQLSSVHKPQLSGNTTQKRPNPHVRRLNRAEELTLAQLAAATNGFSIENRIGIALSFVVYIGKLPDGGEVVVKRRDTGYQREKFQEEDSYFENELTFLSRLHHKHLVRLVGYCEEGNEIILVYEYLKMDLYKNTRVCDFGMSVLGSESESNHKLEKAAGTVGYIDPEFYSRNVLTTKSDVYSLGVVLELLTGKRAIFKDEDNGDAIKSTVDFATTKILANEWSRPSITNIVANLEQASSLCDVHNEGLPIDAEQLHGRSDKNEANSNGTEKHHSEISGRQQ
ncbi:hypothetical protein GH714_013195 [Hevea brasiliensis]|uniref:Protein kinase domain-containing protein n=1 Tax=Hevea brasiliensis TaxID=3981 RepID=A0A6A6N4K5_HEVBR|nr:hypothetical protein GH714_013195 [Hevea brasiliensis]